MQKAIAWVFGLFGNNWKMIVLIFAFLALLIFFASRAHAQTSVDLAGGASFGCLHGGPVLELDIVNPIAEGFSWSFGTTLWGSAAGIRNNFDWHARAEFSRGAFGAAIGPAYLQNIDSVDGSHTNFSLMLFWRFHRIGARVIHLSNGGTSRDNCGRNAVLAEVKLR